MSLHQFNPGIKSWKMYAKELTSKSGDDLTIRPYDGHDLILEASGNGSILFKQDGITYTMADLSNGGTSELVSGTGITISNDVISIGQNVGITSNVTFNNITSNDTINDVYIKSDTANFTNSMSITNHNFTSINGAINNTFFGYNSGTPLSTGDANVGIGNTSLNKITSGNYNTAIGYASLYDNTIGYENTATGYLSMNKNINGTYNTAIGSYTLYLNTNGQYNTAIGSYALYSTTGSYNIALGFNAAASITSGSNNICIGYNSQLQNNTNSNEIVIGHSGQGNGANTTTLGNTSTTHTHIYGHLQIKTGDNNLSIIDNTYASTANYDFVKGMLINGTGQNAYFRVGVNKVTSATQSTGSIFCNTQFKLYVSTQAIYQTAIYDHDFFVPAGKGIKLNGSYVQSVPSDDRIKFNETLVENGLAVIDQINIYKYDKVYEIGHTPENNPYKKEIGVIAQEIQQIPELAQSVCVNEVPDGGAEYFPNGVPMSIYYDQIHSYHIKATQELHIIVQNQQTTINDQQNTINELNTKVQSLEYENLLIKSALNELLSEAGKSTI